MPSPSPGLPVQLLTAGSAACVADLITFPLDTAKVRLQVQGEASALVMEGSSRYAGVIGTVKNIASHEGPKALYNGIVPGLQRQMAFSAIRIGAYENVKQFYKNKTNGTAIRITVGLHFTCGSMTIANFILQLNLELGCYW